jgi:hypothetical protein
MRRKIKFVTTNFGFQKKISTKTRETKQNKDIQEENWSFQLCSNNLWLSKQKQKQKQKQKRKQNLKKKTKKTEKENI